MLLRQHRSTIILLLATMIRDAPVAGETRNGGTSAPEQCLSPKCLALSAMLMRSMNLSADPCDDFNAYACGNYRANTLYDPADVSWTGEGGGEPAVMRSGFDAVRVGVSRRVFETLLLRRPPAGCDAEDPDVGVMNRLSQSLFRSCFVWLRKRNQRGPSAGSNGGGDLETSKIFLNGVLTHLLDSIVLAGRPVAFEKALAKMVRYGVWPLVEVGPTGREAEAGSGARVRLDYSIWDLPTWNLTRHASFVQSLSMAANLTLTRPEEFTQIVRELQHNVQLFDNALSAEDNVKRWENCSEAVDFLDTGKTEFTVGELDGLGRCASPESPFSWTAFLDGVLDGKVKPETLIEADSMRNLNNIINLVNYFKSRWFATPHEGRFSVHASFLIFDWLLSFSPYFPMHLPPKSSRRSARSSMPTLHGDESASDCMMLTRKLLGPIVERMFQKAYHAENFDHVRGLVELVQNSTIEGVMQQAWITPSSKDAIVDKIMSLKREIGFHVFSVQQLKVFYASSIRAFRAGRYTDSYKDFGVLMSLAMCANAGRQNNLLSTDIPTSVLASFDALVVNAFSYTEKNQIVFPMGILTPFLYHRSYPDYVNLAGIGFAIGHEVGHGFDDEGHEVNKQGDRRHFWDSRTESGYRERVRCTAARYATYELTPGQPHNSATTLGNDISDLMGIRSAFRAVKLLGQRGGRYQRLPNLPASLTPERLFFVQLAQAWCAKAEPEELIRSFRRSKHSPPQIRIRGMLENSPDFASVFQCRPDQRMNPRDKCVFW